MGLGKNRLGVVWGGDSGRAAEVGLGGSRVMRVSCEFFSRFSCFLLHFMLPSVLEG